MRKPIKPPKPRITYHRWSRIWFLDTGYTDLLFDTWVEAIKHAERICDDYEEKFGKIGWREVLLMNRRVSTWYVSPEYGPRIWVWHGPVLVYCGPVDRYLSNRVYLRSERPSDEGHAERICDDYENSLYDWIAEGRRDKHI